MKKKLLLGIISGAIVTITVGGLISYLNKRKSIYMDENLDEYDYEPNTCEYGAVTKDDFKRS